MKANHYLAGVVAASVATVGLTLANHSASATTVDKNPTAAAELTGISPGADILTADYDLSGALDSVVASGATWIRIDVNWCWIEQSAGDRDKDARWTDVDRVVNAAQTRGLKILGIVRGSAQYTTHSAIPCEHGPADPTQRTQFADFARDTAARYRDTISAWEVWNEPNLDMFWKDPNPTTYAALLKVTGPAIKEGNPSATVLAGGTGGARPDSVDWDSVDWYQEVYRTPGISAAFDAAAVHPYVSVADGVVQVPSGELSAARRIRTLLDQVDPGKTLWATEVGVPTGGIPGSDGDNHAVSQEKQAQALSAITQQWRTIAPTTPLFYYGLIDNPTDPTREGYFGYITADGRRKPAFSTLQSLTQAPGSAVPRTIPSTIPSPDPSVSASPAPVAPTSRVTQDGPSATSDPSGPSPAPSATVPSVTVAPTPSSGKRRARVRPHRPQFSRTAF